VVVAGSRRFVDGGQAVAVLAAADRYFDQVRLDLAFGVGFGGLLLAAHRVGVGALLGDGGVAVVQVLGGVAHDQGGGVHQFLGEVARVGVHAFAHGVTAHVFDTAGDDDVVGAESDAGRGGGHRGHGARAHAVDGVAGHAAGQSGEDGGAAADGHSLVADLGGGGDSDFVDAFRGQCGVAAQQFADDPDDEVVRAGLGVKAFIGLTKRSAHPVDEYDVAGSSRHDCPSFIRRMAGCRPYATHQ